MPHLERDGARIHYEVHGSGPAILLSHGFASTSVMWRGQIGPLSAAHTLILWDMRGHGRSDAPDDPGQYGEDLTVGDMAAILDVVGADAAVIGGLSLGGYMSLAFHRVLPARTRALLICDATPGSEDVERRAAWNAQAERTARRFADQGLGALDETSPARDAALHRNARGLEHAARGMVAMRDARVVRSLPFIRVPSLIVVGALDAEFLDAARYMGRAIPDAETIVIEGAGHMANVDRPWEFNGAVSRFLASHAL